MNADALGPELGGHVAHRAFQRRLGDAHDVVVLHDHLAAVVAHGEERAAVLHQRLGEMRHADERPAGHVHGGEEAVARARRRRGRAACPSARRRWSGRENRACPTPSRCARTPPPSGPASSTSSGMKIGASSSRASGSTIFLGLVVEIGDRELGARARGMPWRSPRRSIDRWRCRRSGLFLPSSSGAFGHRDHVMPSSRMAFDVFAVRKQRQRVPRDHQFLVGRHDIERDAAAGPRDQWLSRRVRGRIELGAEPGQLLRRCARASSAEFSPMPAVNTKASSPPSAAASIPA